MSVAAGGLFLSVNVLRAVKPLMKRKYSMGVGSPRGLKRCCVVLMVGVFGVGAAFGGEQAKPAAINAVLLVRQSVQHRLEEDKDHKPVRYLLRKQNMQRVTTKEIIETKDGDVARLIEVDDKPLSDARNQAELERLRNLADHPELQERRKNAEMKDNARIDHLMSMLPDAEIYRFEGVVPCGAGKCYHLSFMPNPKFVPPNMEANILRGFAGEVWIDKAQDRLTRLDGHLVADVDFGFGIIGKMNKGGTVELRQADVDGYEWEFTKLKVHMTGRALLIKPVTIQLDEEASDFSPVSTNLTYKDAIRMLESPSHPGAVQHR